MICRTEPIQKGFAHMAFRKPTPAQFRMARANTGLDQAAIARKDHSVTQSDISRLEHGGVVRGATPYLVTRIYEEMDLRFLDDGESVVKVSSRVGAGP
jgi:predicted transcriptional regulator